MRPASTLVPVMANVSVRNGQNCDAAFGKRVEHPIGWHHFPSGIDGGQSFSLMADTVGTHPNPGSQ